MINDVFTRVAEGIFAPRQSMRRVFESGPHGIETVLALVVLAYVIQAMAMVAVPGLRPLDGTILGWHFRALFQNFIQFLLIAALTLGLGRMFGGTGGSERTFLGMAWCGFVSSFLFPLLLAGLPRGPDDPPSALGVLLLFTGVAIGFRIAAGCIAEIHGFRSTGAVLGALVIIVVMITLVALVLIPAPPA